MLNIDKNSRKHNDIISHSIMFRFIGTAIKMMKFATNNESIDNPNIIRERLLFTTAFVQ